MTLQTKIADLDSLERMEVELEIDKRLEKKRNAETKRDLQDCFGAHNVVHAEMLINFLDKRYVKR